MGEPVIKPYQVSMTEWLAAVGKEQESQKFREEDNQKGKRLTFLADTINLPYRRPVIFSAQDAFNKTADFAKVLNERKEELCAFRLTGNIPELPKLRKRGLTVEECYTTWFLKLHIDFDNYTLAILPDEQDIEWSLIFVINDKGIFGEIMQGLHVQLSQGTAIIEPIRFVYDFSTWQWSQHDAEAKKQVQYALSKVHVPNKKKQKLIQKELPNARFSNGYLTGYFESTRPEGDDMYFLDYNLMLLSHFKGLPTFIPSQKNSATLSGAAAYPGKIKGKVHIIDDISTQSSFSEGDVLVCDTTDVRYVPFMQKASAIITNKGGILSHAAIVARELKKPCIVGTKNATTILLQGEVVTVDANKGIITRHA